MAAAAIPLALQLASVYVPEIITWIRQIRKKDGTIVNTMTIIEKLDEADAQFADNIAASQKWFMEHGLNADGSPIVPPAPPAPPAAPGT